MTMDLRESETIVTGPQASASSCSQQGAIFFSNRIESLFVGLRHLLFAEGTTAFTKRLLVVPSQAMKNWLMLQLANDPQLHIAAGIEVAFLDEAVAQLGHNLAKRPDSLKAQVQPNQQLL